MFRFVISLASVFFILLELNSFAQGGTLLMEGKVHFGASMPPAGQFIINLESEAGIVIQTARTLDGGNFQFRNVLNGQFYVTVDIDGFLPHRQFVEVTGRTYVDVVLRPANESGGEAAGGFAGDSDVVDFIELKTRYPDKAVEGYEKALEDIADGKTERAIERLEETLQLAPDFYQALNNLGILYQKGGRFDDAESQFRRAHALDREVAQPLINIGNLWLAQDDFRPAEIVLREAVRLDPLSPIAHYYLGSALYKLSQLEEAEEILLEALYFDSAPATRLMLVNVYLQQKNNQAALEQLDGYLEENRYGAEREAVQKLRNQILKRVGG